MIEHLFIDSYNITQQERFFAKAKRGAITVQLTFLILLVVLLLLMPWGAPNSYQYELAAPQHERASTALLWESVDGAHELQEESQVEILIGHILREYYYEQEKLTPAQRISHRETLRRHQRLHQIFLAGRNSYEHGKVIHLINGEKHFPFMDDDILLTALIAVLIGLFILYGFYHVAMSFVRSDALDDYPEAHRSFYNMGVTSWIRYSKTLQKELQNLYYLAFPYSFVWLFRLYLKERKGLRDRDPDSKFYQWEQERLWMQDHPNKVAIWEAIRIAELTQQLRGEQVYGIKDHHVKAACKEVERLMEEYSYETWRGDQEKS